MERTTATLDTRDLERAIKSLQNDIGESSKIAMRHGTIHLLTSLRARTKLSPKGVKMRDVRVVRGPKGWTHNNRKALCRRVEILRDTDKGKVWKHYMIEVGTESQGKNFSEIRRRARARYGMFRLRGLAKRSWGWMMHEAFGTSVGGNPNLRRPKGLISRMSVSSGDVKTVAYTGLNSLNYSKESLKEGAEQAAVTAAAKRIAWLIKTELERRKR